MRKISLLITAVLLLNANTFHAQAADSQLVPVGNLPRVLSGDYGAPGEFVFDLPSSAPLGTAERARRDVFYVYKDADGNLAYPVNTDGGFNRAVTVYSRGVVGNRMSFTLNFSFMGSYELHFVARTASETYVYRTNVEVVFQKDGTGLGFLGPNYLQKLPNGSVAYEVEKPAGKKETFINVSNNAPSGVTLCVGVIAKSNYERFARAVQKPSENLLDIENYQRAYPTTCENIERGKTKSYSITERQYFTDNPVLYVRYNYGGWSGPVSPDFVFTLPISADFPKPRKEITLECESIFIEKTSECSVTPKAYLSDGSQVLQSEQTEIRVRRMDGSSIVLKTKFSESSRFSIGPAETPAKVTAAFLDGTAETSITPTMYQYSPSEMYSTAWRNNCKINKSSIDCELIPNTKVNPGFKKPSEVSLIIDSYKASNKTGTIEKSEIRNVVVNAEKTYLLSIPFDPLIQNLDFYSLSNEDLTSTWKNPKYVAPIIGYSKDNTWLQISCPKNISGNSLSCKATLVTGATTKKVLPVEIQTRTDGGTWRTESRASLSSGKSVKFMIIDRSKKSIAVRLAARVGSSSIYSSVNSWTVNQANNNSSVQSNESATYKRFYKLMTDLWNQNSAGIASAIPRFGGRNGYCLSLLTASQNETGIRLTYDEGVDFLKACLDFLISKGR